MAEVSVSCQTSSQREARRLTMSVNDPFSQPLMRVRQGKLIAGVCGGIAKWLGWDPTLVRLGYVVLTVLSVGFPGILMYILLWILMPQEPV
jgi:phage shock protein C